MKIFSAKALLLLFLFSSGPTGPAKSSEKRPVTEAEAVKLAEDFVRRNGYTADSADTSVYKLSYELTDGGFTMTQLLAFRHNSLSPKAYSLRRSGDAWHIVFLNANAVLQAGETDKPGNLRGRAVIMDIYGEKIRMAHKEPVISSFKKL